MNKIILLAILLFIPCYSFADEYMFVFNLENETNFIYCKNEQEKEDALQNNKKINDYINFQISLQEFNLQFYATPPLVTIKLKKSIPLIKGENIKRINLNELKENKEYILIAKSIESFLYTPQEYHKTLKEMEKNDPVYFSYCEDKQKVNQRLADMRDLQLIGIIEGNNLVQTSCEIENILEEKR